MSSGLGVVDGHEVYTIADLTRIEPFLIGMVSDGDRWAFVSSNGPITAGRRNPDDSLFPYETDDRLHRNTGVTGPVTALRVGGTDPSDDQSIRWRPFDPARTSAQRWIAKTVVGDAVTFGDSDPGSGLAFEWTWKTANEFGFIRTATLTNTGDETTSIDIVDGILGVMPSGLSANVYQRLSNLSNAYRRSELLDDGRFGLAVYSVEAPVSDQANPKEVLRANVVWHTGFDGASVSVDPTTLDRFVEGVDARPPRDRLLTGRPGAYLLRGTIELAAGASVSWRLVADVALGQSDIVELRERLAAIEDLPTELDDAVNRNHRNLRGLMSMADAQQLGGDAIAAAHHWSNVTYNVLRGGVPLNGYQVDVADLLAFLGVRNRAVLARNEAWLAARGVTLDRTALLRLVSERGDADLERLCLEYLPFSFSRRHGDPSRPWNHFDIRVRDSAGEALVYFEGNWRDVFQNWEALCCSFPEYLPGVISMFVNASTADGYNAYRIGRNGIDWEVPDPDDPWANIGYWGDHQVAYLLRLLRQCERFAPGALDGYLTRAMFTYADVPYRIANYEEMLVDPRATIDFDRARAAAVAGRVAAIGSDGKLMVDSRGELARATLIEKLLVTALAKMVNFVPGAGIWMNTQRPEWNDANNALVGYGASIVTLIYLRQFVELLGELSRRLEGAANGGAVAVSTEVGDWLTAVASALSCDVDAAVADAKARRALMDELGRAGDDYRNALKTRGLSGTTREIGAAELTRFCAVSLRHLDATFASNWRTDGLVHSYNLLRFDGAEVGIDRLPLMLEGQVAAISSGPMTLQARADLVDALFDSRLYRADQRSFVLMEAPELPSFLDRNTVRNADSDPLLAALLTVGDSSVVTRDVCGAVRFNPDLVDSVALRERLDELAERDVARWAGLVDEQRGDVMELFEATFHHRSYLGRSGSMYAYEGIGSVYWHMVTKLLLAIQEAVLESIDRGERDNGAVDRLIDRYRAVRDGLGFRKSAVEFGANPIDPYSHTPAHSGAQQPGMTGAVKEELLARWAEVGIRIEDGRVVFDPRFVEHSELLDHERLWHVEVLSQGSGGERSQVSVPSGAIATTFCQVPVIVQIAAEEQSKIRCELIDGTELEVLGTSLDADISREIFARSGKVVMVRAVLAGSDSRR